MITLSNAEGRATVKIGIDPGATTGLAIYFKATKALTLHQFTCQYEAMLHVHEFSKAQAKAGEAVHLVIEDARLAKTNAHFGSKNGGRKDQGVGDVKGACREWERFCEYAGLSYELRPPARTKMDAALFQKLTGIETPKAHSHKRDAALLVWN